MLRTKGKHVSVIELVERNVVTWYRHLIGRKIRKSVDDAEDVGRRAVLPRS